ncbi:MAG: efflux RND transporter periplasmic adaptor subunit [Candidatus Eiseniibacteriota bacterium]
MRKVLAVPLVLGLAFLAFRLFAGGDDAGTEYRLVEVTRGDVESIVTATGKLDAVKSVEVGTQVSGQVTEILADFNDRVEAGQLIARIDPTLPQQEVRAAEAGLSRARAELDYQTRELERLAGLLEQGAASEAQHNAVEYALSLAKAGFESAEVALDRARRNLVYTEIRSPIDGVVIARNVDVGQTVAASLSAPLLFLIAEDLSQMEILASVDEADIGSIREGQPVRFTVQAYPDETFAGTVKQVRFQSTVQENVVNYTVVVGTANESGRLLPGMTATVEFLLETATDVLRVSNAALRFRPTEEMLEQLRARREAEGAQAASADSGAGGGRRGAGGGSGAKLLWLLDADGTPRATRVRVGVSDGQLTEIEGEGIEAGMSVIAGILEASGEGATTPFQGQQPASGPGPPRLPGG